MAVYPFLKEFAEKEKSPTPAYVFDLDGLDAYVKKVADCLKGRAEICYAMKANPFLTAPLKDVVESFEVCSPGEFRICQRAGIPMEKITLSGVYKNPEDIRYVLSEYGGKGVYTVESWEHLRHLQTAASELGIQIQVLLRVTSGNQFGMDEQDIRKIIADREQYPALHILGLQFYSGTQKKKLTQMKTELESLDAFLEELEQAYGFFAEQLEYGPGFFAPYFKKDSEEDAKILLGEFCEILDGLRFRGKIILEMGRFLTYRFGYYITSIVDKKVNHDQSYVIMDGGIHHLNYYGQTMAMKQPYCTQLDRMGEIADRGEDELWNLCGALCTVSDVTVKNFPLKKPELRDLLIFERVGAYSVTEGIYLFLSRPLPAVYFWSEKEGLRLVRESFHTDILNSENKKK